MNTYYKTLIFLVLFVLKAQIVYPQWVQTNGPGSGILTSIAASGDKIIACNNTGYVYFSFNNGTNWSQVNNVLANTVINSFVFSGNNIFACTGLGVYLSADNGANWIQTGLNDYSVNSLTMSGNNIFATTSTGGVFFSPDNGANWTQVNNGLASMDVRALAVSGNNIFAGTGLGVYLSADNGTNWTQVNNGLASMDVRTLAVCGTNIFAGTGLGVSYSADNGANWVSKINPMFPPIDFLAVSGNNIFAGAKSNYYSIYGSQCLFLSTNNGIDWNNVHLLGNITALGFSGTNVYAGIANGAGRDYGLYRLTNDGTDINKVGLPLSIVSALIVSGNYIFAGAEKPYYSTDNGINWKLGVTSNINVDPFFLTAVTSFVVNGNDIFMTSYTGVYRSTDNGYHWSKICPNALDGPYSVAASGNNIFVGFSHGGRR